MGRVGARVPVSPASHAPPPTLCTHMPQYLRPPYVPTRPPFEGGSLTISALSPAHLPTTPPRLYR
eukprot:scaffold51448_cov64-Phaeocystis_antarctica.AAC.9